MQTTQAGHSLARENATSGDAATIAEHAFDAVRPVAAVSERHATQIVDPSALLESALAGGAVLAARMSTGFEPQFESRYLSCAFPWIWKYMNGGADFTRFSGALGTRWRRGEHAAYLAPERVARNLAGRVKMQFPSDWNVVAAARGLSVYYAVLQQTHLTCRMPIPAAKPLAASAAELVDAAMSLHEKLRRVSCTVQGRNVPINGDPRKLRFADGLSKPESNILGSYGRVTHKFPGTQEIRRAMHPAMLGCRVQYGEGVFLTISPNRRHSTVVLCFARVRVKDTMLQATDEASHWRRRLAGCNLPPLYFPAGTDVEEGVSSIPMLPLPERQALNARGPLSSVKHYDVSIRAMLARFLGVGMCPRCPHCNVGAWGSIQSTTEDSIIRLLLRGCRNKCW